MISTSPTMRILLATEPVDFYKGIDRLAAICRKQRAQDPMTACVFVVRNRKGTAVKIPLYDGKTQGEADALLARTGDAVGQQHLRASVEDGDLTEVQRHEGQVKAAPARWLPWNDQAARIVLERGSALD